MRLLMYMTLEGLAKAEWYTETRVDQMRKPQDEVRGLKILLGVSSG